jgi:hypothetical protein
MVTHHELGESSHNREEESDERRVVETPPYLAETVRILMEELQSCKADNERLIKEQEKQTEINAVMLQILSYIQRQLQHGPMASNVEDIILRKTKVHLRYKSMALKIDNTRRSTSKKARHGAKKHANVESSPEESSSEETDSSKELSSSETSSPFSREKKKEKMS